MNKTLELIKKVWGKIRSFFKNLSEKIKSTTEIVYNERVSLFLLVIIGLLFQKNAPLPSPTFLCQSVTTKSTFGITNTRIGPDLECMALQSGEQKSGHEYQMKELEKKQEHEIIKMFMEFSLSERSDNITKVAAMIYLGKVDPRYEKALIEALKKEANTSQ
ncbi:MAG: hypothetical protein NDI81_12160 [Desulfobacula sp.]|nr:hypothetical protein [Desulfobacula sp.]